MKTRIVKSIYPFKRSKKLIRLSLSKVPVTKTCITIYDTVDFFLQNIFLKSKFKMVVRPIKNCILLDNIINLHNDDGVRLPQIGSMFRQIISGKDIFHTNGLPNSRLVKSKEGKLVLFDGHHTMLAYMLAGRKYLHEMPHLIVENEKKENVSDKEISIFFGEHTSKLKNNNWRKYTINWQVPREKQLCKRVRKNMGELFDALSSKFSNYL